MVQVITLSPGLQPAITPTFPGRQRQTLQISRGYVQLTNDTPDWPETPLQNQRISEAPPSEGTTAIATRTPIIFPFPSPFLEPARKIYDRIKSLHWGAASEEEVKPKRSLRLPPPNHPIFGPNGLMKGILMGSPDSNSNSFRINKRFNKIDAGVYGHNSLNVGAWWPHQICTLRDGAHGHRVAGISGSDIRMDPTSKLPLTGKS